MNRCESRMDDDGVGRMLRRPSTSSAGIERRIVADEDMVGCLLRVCSSYIDKMKKMKFEIRRQSTIAA